MDSLRFDAFTRSLAACRTRRSAVQGMATGILASVLGFGVWQKGAAAARNDRCNRLPPGSAQDQCQAACTQIEQTRTEAGQTRATAEAAANQARSTAEAAATEARGGVRDFFCDKKLFWCLSPDRTNRVGDIGEQAMCYHASTASCRACNPDANDQLCNTTYPTRCHGLCTAEHGCGTIENFKCWRCPGDVVPTEEVGPYLACIDPTGDGCSPCASGYSTANAACNATYPTYCDGRCYTDTTATPC